MAVVADRDWILVDCGRAATQRAIDAGLDLTSVVAVAITHHHSDHVSDLATFATARWTAGARTPLTVVVPSGPAATFVDRCLSAYDDQCFYAQAPAAAGSRPGARTVGELAARTRPMTLVLTHLFPAPRTPDDERAYVEDVRAGGFEGHLVVARDLLQVDVAT